MVKRITVFNESLSGMNLYNRYRKVYVKGLCELGYLTTNLALALRAFGSILE